MNDYEFVDGTRLSSVIESLIFTSPEPIPAVKICEIVAQGDPGGIGEELEPEAVEAFVERLNQRYDEQGLAFGIEFVAGGFTFVTRKRFEPWLSIFQHENAYRKLSQSAIETLAIVAYRQPITKPEVDQIRGVDSGYTLRQLMEKVLVEVSGRLDAPGKPLLYRTSRHFLKHFGLNSIKELPRPREIEEILKDDDMADHRKFLLDHNRDIQMNLLDDPETEISEEVPAASGITNPAALETSASETAGHPVVNDPETNNAGTTGEEVNGVETTGHSVVNDPKNKDAETAGPETNGREHQHE